MPTENREPEDLEDSMSELMQAHLDDVTGASASAGIVVTIGGFQRSPSSNCSS